MPITATKQSQFEQIPEGAYPARIYRILHIGTIPNEAFGGKNNKAYISFEFPTELREFDKAKGEQPMVLSQEYTLSFGDKSNLKKVIDACDPKALKIGTDGVVEEYDIESLLGKCCLVTVTHKTTAKGTYANIGACTVLPKGMDCPSQMNPSTLLNYDSFNEALFNSLPEFIKKKIESSDEYKMMKGEVPSIDDLDIDAIPF